MPYNAQISRDNPTAFLFLIDQSGSMAEDLPEEGKTKAEKLAEVVNNTLADLITKCTKADGTRDYFDIGVIGYGGHIINALQGPLSDKIMQPISAIEANPLRIDEKVELVDDGEGGFMEETTLSPIWVEPRAYGGTPMRKALLKAAEEMAAWCDAHPDSYPPTILHITDGEANDGDPEELAQGIADLSTNDGNIVFLNFHLSTEDAAPLMYPATEDAAPDPYAKMLFRMSSVLPTMLQECAREKHYNIDPQSRGFIFMGKSDDIQDFFDIGTRAAN